MDSANQTIAISVQVDSTPNTREPLRGFSGSSVWVDEAETSSWITARPDLFARADSDHRLDAMSSWIMGADFARVRSEPPAQSSSFSRHVRELYEQERENSRRLRSFIYERLPAYMSPMPSFHEAMSHLQLGVPHEGSDPISSPSQPVHDVEVVPMPEASGEGLSELAKELASLILDTRVDIERLKGSRFSDQLGRHAWSIISDPLFLAHQHEQNVRDMREGDTVYALFNTSDFSTTTNSEIEWTICEYVLYDRFFQNRNGGHNRAVIEAACKILKIPFTKILDLATSRGSVEFTRGDWPENRNTDSTKALMQFCLKTISDFYASRTLPTTTVERPSVYML